MESDFQKPEKITEQMKGGLARMFADTDFKDYLTHAINVANHNILACLKINKSDFAKDYSIRLESLQQLLELGKKNYLQSEKLKRSSLEDLSKEKDGTDN